MGFVTGIIGRAYNKLFDPLLAFKDELSLITENQDDKELAKKDMVRELIKEVFGKEIKGDIDLNVVENQLKVLLN